MSKEKNDKVTKDEQKEEKYLHECETKIDLSEFQKMIKYMPKVYWTYVGIAAIVSLIFALFVGYGTKTIDFIFAYIAVMIIMMVYIKYKLSDLAKYHYNILTKNHEIETDIKYTFYNNYFNTSVSKGNVDIKYSDLKKIIETNTNFYFKTKNKKIHIIQKNKCSEELILFIKEQIMHKIK